MDIAWFVTAKILPMFAQMTFIIFSLWATTIINLIPICLSRAKNIPQHIQILKSIYNDMDPDSQYKKYLSTALLLLASLLSFMAYSFIPFTGAPFIHVVTVPIAIMLSFLVFCFTFEMLLPAFASGSINVEKLHREFGPGLDKLKDDYLTIKSKIGPSWDKLYAKFMKLIEDNSKQIAEWEKKCKMSTAQFCEEIEIYITPPLQDLTVYVSQNSDLIKLGNEDLKIIQERIEAWKKVGVSTTLSVGSGMGVLAAAKATLIPATLWQNTLNIFGLGSSGILVSGTTFTLATTVLPAAIAGGAFLGSIYGFKKIEDTKLSKFLADAYIASMPMLYADGAMNEEERVVILQLASNRILRETDRKRILRALEQPIDLDYVFNSHLMYEKKSEKAQIKARLMLSIAWEIARSDRIIHPKEIEMHNRMAKLLSVEWNYCKEVRALLTPCLIGDNHE